MIKELQSRVLRLEESLETKQQDFLKKKQNYQKIIEELQQENQKLKNIIQEMNLSREQELNRAKSIDHIPHQEGLSDYEFKEGHFTRNDYSQLIHENNYLKQEIATISVTYQKQMQFCPQSHREELTKYFQKIKSSSRLSESYAIDAANSKQVSGKISVLMNAYESLLKNYDSEKQKFTDKIQELSKYLELTNDKNRSLLEEKIRVEKKLKNSEDRLRLFRENLGV